MPSIYLLTDESWISIVTAILATITLVTSMILNNRISTVDAKVDAAQKLNTTELEGVRHTVNSGLDKLVDKVEAAAFARGVKEEKANPNGEDKG